MGTEQKDLRLLGAPEELEHIWDEAIKKAWDSLSQKHQEFFLAYMAEWNGAEAYRQVYNPDAKDQVAANSASRILLNVHIKAILRKLSDTRFEDLIFVKDVLKKAATTAVKPDYEKNEDGKWEITDMAPDHDVRIKAVDKMAKIAKLYDEEIEIESPDDKTKKKITMGGVTIEFD